MGNKTQCRKPAKLKTCSLKKIHKIGKLLARLIRETREKTQITNIKNKREDITTNSTDTKRISEYYE